MNTDTYYKKVLGIVAHLLEKLVTDDDDQRVPYSCQENYINNLIDTINLFLKED